MSRTRTQRNSTFFHRIPSHPSHLNFCFILKNSEHAFIYRFMLGNQAKRELGRLWDMILPSLLFPRGLVALVSYFNLLPRLNSKRFVVSVYGYLARECLSNKKISKELLSLLWQKQSKCLDSFPFSRLFFFIWLLRFPF